MPDASPSKKITKKTVAIGLLGTTLDKKGVGQERWERWRPTIAMCQQDDMVIDRLELMYSNRYSHLMSQMVEDIKMISPETQIVPHEQGFDDPWDFAAVYGALLDFAQQYTFKPEEENYLIHITTGSHVAQICLFLLTEAGFLPGKLLQTAPGPNQRGRVMESRYQIIDLDLSKYDQLAQRFQKEHELGTEYLKGGIQTQNPAFNQMIKQVEQVSIRSIEPILLTGPTGAGKSQLAKRIFELKQQRHQISGRLVQVNCATLRGENAMSALFGHKKGAFTGAVSQRPGLLKEAHQGLLFLDEIGELGLDEQAMLLHAIEEKTFLPVGSDKEVHSDFQLISGTNRNLYKSVERGEFREDLLARINLWSYELPCLKNRIEDLSPNIDFELERWAKQHQQQVRFNTGARQHYMNFAVSPQALWSANFRDLNASIKRMATLAVGGTRITENIVKEEVSRLIKHWGHTSGVSDSNNDEDYKVCQRLLGTESSQDLDLFDVCQLATVIRVCESASSMAEAGRELFSQSRMHKKSPNDSHRIRQYLEKYGLSFQDIKQKQIEK